jgi:hypothetical protein
VGLQILIQSGIKEGRKRCEATGGTFRVRAGGDPQSGGDWECASAAVIARETAEAQARAVANAQREQAEAAANAQKNAQLIALFDVATRNCGRYNAAPNEIQKSAIYEAHREELEKLRLTDVRGTLRLLETPHGGGVANIEIEVKESGGEEREVVFRNPHLSPVSGDVYQQAAALRVNGCVIFSATEPQPPLGPELSMVCGQDEFTVEFESLRLCTP